jgi:hypothetical protein
MAVITNKPHHMALNVVEKRRAIYRLQPGRAVEAPYEALTDGVATEKQTKINTVRNSEKYT